MLVPGRVPKPRFEMSSGGVMRPPTMASACCRPITSATMKPTWDVCAVCAYVSGAHRRGRREGRADC